MKKLQMSILTVAIQIAFSALFGCQFYQPSASSDLFIQSHGSTAKIPDGFRTYTLFLVTDYSLKKSYTTNQWKTLRYGFIKLGESIGEENAAVWITDTNEYIPSVARSRDIVDKINKDASAIDSRLNYGKSPVIVFLNYNPELPKIRAMQYFTAIEFEGCDPHKILLFMDKLAQLIREGGPYRGRLETEELIFNIKNMMDKLSPEIGFTAGRFSIKLSPSKRN